MVVKNRALQHKFVFVEKHSGNCRLWNALSEMLGIGQQNNTGNNHIMGFHDTEIDIDIVVCCGMLFRKCSASGHPKNTGNNHE